jgi:hypothetical protein
MVLKRHPAGLRGDTGTASDLHPVSVSFHDKEVIHLQDAGSELDITRF